MNVNSDRGVFQYVADSAILVPSRLARLGIHHFRVTYHASGPVASVWTTRGLLGWYARRWFRRNPTEFSCFMLTEADPEWREYRTPVEILRMGPSELQ